MTDLRTEFTRWYWNDFAGRYPHDLWTAMDECKEDSPWHREESVGVHTNMVVSEFLASRYVPSEWIKGPTLLGAFAAAFHDVGKPGARQRKFKPERGEYNSFNGHEQLSARLWETYAVENWHMLSTRFGMDVEDIYSVGYLIEMHKPWDIKRPEKLAAMALTLLAQNVDATFAGLVLADTWGRISDDMDEKKLKVSAWVEEYERRCMGLAGHSILYERSNPGVKPVLWVPVAASGSGKSTWRATIDAQGYSLDDLRLEFYGEPYEDAFWQSTKDKHFKSRSNERFRDLLRTGESIVLDNTNTSRKNRRWFLSEAARYGYFLNAVLLPVTLEEVLARQETREDKVVPADAVKRQYNGIQLPQFGEFDNVTVLDVNL